MPPDAERIGEIREWLTKAQTDLSAGRHLLLADKPFTGDAAFHAQQATEKTLKAFLSWHDVPFGKLTI